MDRRCGELLLVILASVVCRFPVSGAENWLTKQVFCRDDNQEISIPGNTGYSMNFHPYRENEPNLTMPYCQWCLTTNADMDVLVQFVVSPPCQSVTSSVTPVFELHNRRKGCVPFAAKNSIHEKYDLNSVGHHKSMLVARGGSVTVTWMQNNGIGSSMHLSASVITNESFSDGALRASQSSIRFSVSPSGYISEAELNNSLIEKSPRVMMRHELLWSKLSDDKSLSDCMETRTKDWFLLGMEHEDKWVPVLVTDNNTHELGPECIGEFMSVRIIKSASNVVSIGVKRIGRDEAVQLPVLTALGGGALLDFCGANGSGDMMICIALLRPAVKRHPSEGCEKWVLLAVIAAVALTAAILIILLYKRGVLTKCRQAVTRRRLQPPNQAADMEENIPMN